MSRFDDSMFRSMHWDRDHVRVDSFRTLTGKAKATTVVVHLSAKDGYALSDLLRQLHDLRAEPAPKAGRTS
ncbi:hypothetical protein I6G65_16010 [Sphingomonas paucimobilis]|uniref:DNA, contig: SP630 n=1 Tax=Sphingomonas paucimobilis NBRC 13935 TaxID=1219050 RepID=A0A0C9N3E8_SPHPI|nr:hypothetical protein [Sphingomonas paucimobilis]QPS15795.1 hypothetical protein I6G65_16010 [Sphingomonas paucimobilis]GAN14134.1 hypothetical protein SP6_30_02750 [Sphingomonas paucimobilis NBRC 13935]SUJ08245.1 Uncharacterised protein [Sphingomonas paucimobilis]